LNVSTDLDLEYQNSARAENFHVRVAN